LSERVAQPVEHVTFNHGVLGSSPSALTKEIKHLDQISQEFIIFRVGKSIAGRRAFVATFEPVLHQSINPDQNQVCGR
jgi:hypothetical protein